MSTKQELVLTIKFMNRDNRRVDVDSLFLATTLSKLRIMELLERLENRGEIEYDKTLHSYHLMNCSGNLGDVALKVPFLAVLGLFIWYTLQAVVLVSHVCMR